MRWKIPPQADLFICGAVAAGRCPRVNLRSGKVSIIIPARNEEVNLERVLCSLASQEGWAEIVVVNDQSDVHSTEILERLRGEIADLIVLNAPELPAGWVGKNHALHWGAARARGRVVLFTDADTRHAPCFLFCSSEVPPGPISGELKYAERAGAIRLRGFNGLLDTQG
ncbi:MAG: glycosyltransferase [Acidobacteriota bacterium]